MQLIRLSILFYCSKNSSFLTPCFMLFWYLCLFYYFFCISSNQWMVCLWYFAFIQSNEIGKIRLFFYWPFIVLNIKRYDLLWFWPNCCRFTDPFCQNVQHFSCSHMFMFHFSFSTYSFITQCSKCNRSIENCKKHTHTHIFKCEITIEEAIIF